MASEWEAGDGTGIGPSSRAEIWHHVRKLCHVNVYAWTNGKGVLAR